MKLQTWVQMEIIAWKRENCNWNLDFLEIPKM